MSVEIVVEADLIRFTLGGVVTEGDLVTLAATADDIERGRNPVPHRITDMTGVTELRIGYPNVKALADRRRSMEFPNPFKSAIVVRTPAQMGIARMFRTLNDNPQITIEVFRDEATALEWLRT